MLTSFADDEALFASIMAGASGYVLKQVRSGDLLRAIRAVGGGDSLLDPAVTKAVLDRLRKGKHLMQRREARAAVAAGGTDPVARRRRPDQQGDRRRAQAGGEDHQELRLEHPVQARGGAARRGGRVPRSTHHHAGQRRIGRAMDRLPDGSLHIAAGRRRPSGRGHRRIRPARADDRERVEDYLIGLSDQSRYFRFGGRLVDVSEIARRSTEIDYRDISRCWPSPTREAGEVIGGAQYIREGDVAARGGQRQRRRRAPGPRPRLDPRRAPRGRRRERPASPRSMPTCCRRTIG